MIKLRQFLITLTLLLSCSISASYALVSTGSIKTTIFDNDAPDIPIAGAVVEVSPAGSPEMKLYFATDANGELLIPTIKVGDYVLTVTFLGYTPKKIEVSLTQAELTLPNIMLESSALAIDAVVKEVKALRASQNGDTLNYNASSFKVADDADVEGLLTKMPGISIDDGEVTAQGETVKKIFIDGREFFGNDVATALKSLPAEIVDRIEVYDNLSDESKFSGIDDGNGEKTINIVTKKSMRKGAFGKVYGGYGYEPGAYAGDFGGGHSFDSSDLDTKEQKYMIGGNVNIFRNTSRITLLGLYNNINQQSFSFEDVAGVTEEDNKSSDFKMKSQPGISRVQAFGINFSDVKGADEKGKNAKLKLQGSYFYNRTFTVNEENIDRWYLDGSDSTIDSLTQRQNQYTDNTNHRFNGKIDWEINDRQSFMIRPSASFQHNRQYRGISGERFKEDDVYQTYGNWREPESYGYSVGASTNYRLKVGDKGHTVTLGGGFNINNWSSETDRENFSAESFSMDQYYEGDTYPASDLSLVRFEESNSHKINLNGNVGYNARLTERMSLSTTYRYTRNAQESDKTTYESDEYIENLRDDANINTESTNDAKSIYTTHKIGPSFRYHKDKSNIVASVNYQYSDLDNTTNLYSESSPSEIDNVYSNVTYSLISQLSFNPEHSLRLQFSSYTSNPAINRLQDIYYISGDYMSKGNPYLDPSYTNRMSARYTYSDLERGRTFMTVLWAQQTNNYLTAHTFLDPHSEGKDAGEMTVKGELYEDVVQYDTWTNLDNYWNFFGRVNYGIPLDFIKCNLNLNFMMNYSLVPSIFGGDYVNGNGEIIGGEENKTSNMSYRIYTVLGSNISDKIDFTLTWRGNYSEATNVSTSSDSGTSKTKAWDQQATATMKFILGGGFTLGARFSYQHYKGITNDYDEQMSILNAYIGYRVFKNKRGEINVGVNDIFDQNISFNRWTGNNYTQNKTDIVVGRYYTVQFIYNLRLFGKNASKNMKDYKIRRDDDDGERHRD